MGYSRNILLLYVYSILIKRVSMPIIILYFLLNHLKFSQIGILAAFMSIISLITEVHGGIFTDMHGKKISLALHSLFGALTMFFYLIGNSFSYFLIASIMYGLAAAFITGTKNALLYDTLSQMGIASEFKKYNGKLLMYSYGVNALILLGIPVVYSYNVKLPFLIGILFFIASLIIALFFIEPPLTRKSKASFAAYNLGLSESVKEISSNKCLFSALLLSMVTASFIFMSAEFNQPLLKISGLAVIYFGVVYAAMRVLTGVGGIAAHKLGKYFKYERLLLFGMIGILISFLGFSQGYGWLLVLSVLVVSFAEGLNRITLEDEINKNIKSSNRTTILSISSLSGSLFKAVLVFFFGFVADSAGIQGMFTYVVIAFAICALLALWLKNAIEKSQNYIKY